MTTDTLNKPIKSAGYFTDGVGTPSTPRSRRR
jgi:hypothetical protein